MSPITTHVLDTALGKPAAGVPVQLYRVAGGEEAAIGEGVTNDDGRVADLLEPGALDAGTYRIVFAIGAYFANTGRESFYPHAEIVFIVKDAAAHYHVPLLLSPYGYSTYRGS